MKQLKLVNVRKMIPLAVVGVVALVPVAAALATAGSGFKERTVVARGTLRSVQDQVAEQLDAGRCRRPEVRARSGGPKRLALPSWPRGRDRPVGTR